MTFRLTPEEATTEGPYTLGPARPLTSLEIAYTQLLVEVALHEVFMPALQGPQPEPARPSPLGRQATKVESLLTNLTNLTANTTTPF